MTFRRIADLVKLQPVLAGLDRTAPAVRARVERLLARFTANAATPLDVIDEGAAFALWGAGTSEAFLRWHVEVGGVARVLDVLLASIAFDRASFEWDNSIWALRAVRPGIGIGNLGLAPWIWLREYLAHSTRADRDAVRAVAAKASRVHAVRCALAFVLPELWTAADETELRQADPGDHIAAEFGVAAAMRTSNASFGDIGRSWNRAEWVPADAVVRHLGRNAVAPLRLLRDFDALAKLFSHGDADALRALVEHADVAWDAIAGVAPSAKSIAAMVPLFTTQPPRRTTGMPLARALFDEHVMVAGAETGDPFVARAIAETGASLPADEDWRSPWAGAPAIKRSAKSNAPKPAAPFAETIHWKPGEREDHLSERAGGDDAADAKRLLREAKTQKVFLLHIGWMHDVNLARATFTAIPPKSWYGQVDDVQMLVAKFGLDALDAIVAFVRAKPDTLGGLANVESPRVAPVMARGFALLKKQQAIGKAWLERFPEAAAIGLVADLATADKKQRAADEQALGHLAKNHAAIVEQHSGAKASELVATAAPALPAKPKPLPGFVDVSRLPRPITSEGHALQGDALVELVQLVATENTAAIDAAVERYTDASLARFAFSLFRQWLVVKGPPKEKWAMHAVGRFGDDQAATALGKLARVWAPMGNPARAQAAVETLAMMRSRTALAEIYDIAHKVQSKALKARAHQVFASLAEAAGMDAEDLADRLVPEVGEDELVFGDVRASFDHMLVPTLAVAPEGDDLARWKKLEKLCKQVARTQLARLEDNMAAAHRMPFLHFAEVYLMHSLIRHLTSSLVWGAYRDGALAFPFAVTADGNAVDLAGKSLQLPSDATYGIVHPIELTASARAAWRERIGEQPFEQLARAVHSAEDARDCERKLSAILQRMVPTAGLLALQRRGWRRGESPQGGCYYTIERDGAGWSAMVQFEPGIYLGAPTEQVTQSVQGVLVRGDAPKAVLSELQRDMFALLQ
ncbi:MAG TPA: DUF4132 domain-containing protein [Kofleriaceae bacterium]|nr:DUF4132 domain-containing protein [Kofleriaceae bacterium]